MPSSYQSGTKGSPHTGSASAKTLSSDRIASDIDSFKKAGGHIEVLGNTPLRGKPEASETSKTASSATPTSEPSTG